MSSLYKLNLLLTLLIIAFDFLKYIGVKNLWKYIQSGKIISVM